MVQILYERAIIFGFKLFVAIRRFVAGRQEQMYSSHNERKVPKWFKFCTVPRFLLVCFNWRRKLKIDLSTTTNEGPIIWVTNYWSYSSGLAPGMESRQAQMYSSRSGWKVSNWFRFCTIPIISKRSGQFFAVILQPQTTDVQWSLFSS